MKVTAIFGSWSEIILFRIHVFLFHMQIVVVTAREIVYCLTFNKQTNRLTI